MLIVQRATMGRNTGIPDEVLGSIGYLSGCKSHSFRHVNLF